MTTKLCETTISALTGRAAARSSCAGLHVHKTALDLASSRCVRLALMQPVGIGVAEPDILAQGCGGAGVVPVDELVARLGVPVPDVLKVTLRKPSRSAATRGRPALDAHFLPDDNEILVRATPRKPGTKPAKYRAPGTKCSPTVGARDRSGWQ